MADFKSFEEMRAMTESEVIQYSCFLMQKKFKILDVVFEQGFDDEILREESKRISEQLSLLSKARRTL